jgi:hypothetical protein
MRKSKSQTRCSNSGRSGSTLSMPTLGKYRPRSTPYPCVQFRLFMRFVPHVLNDAEFLRALVLARLAKVVDELLTRFVLLKVQFKVAGASLKAGAYAPIPRARGGTRPARA